MFAPAITTLLLILAAPPAALPRVRPSVEIIAGIAVGRWNKTAHSVVPTQCDRLAAYAPDRDAVSPPKAHEQIDVPVAIAACRRAIAGEPANPRFHYQIARLLNYAGDDGGARSERLVAAVAGYPAALFVLGYQLAFARTAADRCGGAALIRRSADEGAFAGQVGLATHQLDGTLIGCQASADKATLARFLISAKGSSHGYFEEQLVASLAREVARLP